MSSSTLAAIETGLILYGYSIFMILGNIGNAFIVIIFSRQHQSACAIYLISAAVGNMVYSTYSYLSIIFKLYYPNSTTHTIIFCKINTYVLNFIGQVPKTFIILTCIDRFLITSNRAGFRAFSTPKRAKYLIFFSCIFWSLFVIHAPIMNTVINGQCTTIGVYSTIYSVYSIMFVALIPTITSAIFGYLSYRNMRQAYNRVQPVVQNTINANYNIHRRDQDLLVIVIAEVVTYVVTTALFPLIQLEMMISEYVMPNKSFQYLQIEIFILNIAYFLLSINSAVPFYVYLISSKSFRRDFKQLIINSYRKLRRQQPVQIVPGADQTFAQQNTGV
jgi:hypothetical protein